MTGMILWTPAEKGRRGVRVAERNILHVRFVCVQIEKGARTPETVMRRRVSRAGKKLRKLEVDRVVLPEAFPYGAILEKYGLRSVSTLTLRRRLAADWVRAALVKRGALAGSTRVAVSAGQLTGEVVRTVTELALRYRYVLLDLPRGGEDLCRQLRREYGVSVLLGPSVEQLEQAEALLLFDPRADLQKKNPVVLPLYGETALLPDLALPPVLEEQLPEGAERGALLAALQEAGALKPGQIMVTAPCRLTF